MKTKYTRCIQRFLKSIGYRHEAFPPYDAQCWGTFHDWMLNVLGPALTSSWNKFNDKQLVELEHLEIKLLYAKLTAIVTLIDDSMEDERMYRDIVQFSDRVYRGETQENAVLALYHESLKTLSGLHKEGSVLRGLAVGPWMDHIDACLMEKELLVLERKRSEADGAELMKYSREDSLASKLRVFGWLPHYLRYKSAVSEAYAACIFKANKEQNLPLTKYMKAIPDIVFFIEVANDILSFLKEELAAEKYNLIHLRTRSIAASGSMCMSGSGPGGTWTPYDTLRLLCDELRDATRRVDGLLRLEECERKIELQGESGLTLNDIDDVDVTIAMQWRGWRDGYISWHLECRRYKLGRLKDVVVAEQEGEKSRRVF
ncbi:terpenoid synthase [Favolaschia claudopus]|uniref:Terpenoid synthase n=1 Tax=Favolaschia claudopus TaxID=2862362 RepID=A0AAW0D4V8_9AGAR